MENKFYLNSFRICQKGRLIKNECGSSTQLLEITIWMGTSDKPGAVLGTEVCLYPKRNVEPLPLHPNIILVPSSVYQFRHCGSSVLQP
jgi:hypothetical protein